jgi:hypothetical protein
MEDSRFLRNIKSPLLLDEDDTPLLVLLRDLFIETDAPFNVKEIASELGVSVFAVYKMFAADRPLRAEALLAIVKHIGTRDHRLVDLICGEAGYTPMPNNVLADRKALRELLEHAERIIKEG